MILCDQCWGSHCCDLPAVHLGVHQCGDGDLSGEPCSQYVDTPEGPRARFSREDGTWGEWAEHSGGFRLSGGAR